MGEKLFDRLSSDQKQRAAKMIPNDKQSGNHIYARQLVKNGELSFVSIHPDLLGKNLNPKNSPYSISHVASKDQALEMAAAYIIQKEGAKGELEAAEMSLKAKQPAIEQPEKDDKNKDLLLEIQRQKEEIAAMRDVIASIGTKPKSGRKPKTEAAKPKTEENDADPEENDADGND